MQSADYKSQVEYDRSHHELANVLKRDETVKAVGKECIDAVEWLQIHLRSKQVLLANHFRIGLTLCMYAKTTSPVESMNKLTKHGPNCVDSNMSLSTSIETLVDGTTVRLDDQMNDSRRKMNQVNRSSRAPTKNEIHPMIQYLVDASYDKKDTIKLVQLSPDEWIAWSFDDEKRYKKPPLRYLPRFHRVWKMVVNSTDGRSFIHCGCQTYEECGWPCSCIFRLVGKMDHMMIKVQHWTAYLPHYGEDSPLGKVCITYIFYIWIVICVIVIRGSTHS